jgi:hypothetical protein
MCICHALERIELSRLWLHSRHATQTILMARGTFAGEVKYCIAKLFSNDVKFATAMGQF